MFYNMGIIWWIPPLPYQVRFSPSVSFLKNKQNKWTTLGASKNPNCHRGLECRTSNVSRCWAGSKGECGGPMFLLMVAGLVWKSPKNGPSHGTESISHPWSSASFLRVFWQAWACSRPESGSPGARVNKQRMKMISLNASGLQSWNGLYLTNNINSCWCAQIQCFQFALLEWVVSYQKY